MLFGYVGANAVAGLLASVTVGLIIGSHRMVVTHSPQFTSPDVATVRRSSRPCPRYTVDGDDALEEHLHHSAELVKEAVVGIFPPNGIEGLLLGGGYGRG